MKDKSQYLIFKEVLKAIIVNNLTKWTKQENELFVKKNLFKNMKRFSL